MPRIYFCDITKFEHCYEEGLSRLPQKRRQKTERFFDKNDRLLSMTAGLMLKKDLGITEDSVLEYNEHGKPFLEHGPCFNISHSGRYSVLAVSEKDIGIDIEMRGNANEGIIKRCFIEDEQDFARMSTENFLRIWTAKEAVLKLLGTGFSFSPKSFSVLPLGAEHEIKGIKMRFFCADINGAPLTVSFCGNDDKFEILEFLPEDLIH